MHVARPERRERTWAHKLGLARALYKAEDAHQISVKQLRYEQLTSSEFTLSTLSALDPFKLAPTMCVTRVAVSADLETQRYRT
jgi:hypothetical protein